MTENNNRSWSGVCPKCGSEKIWDEENIRDREYNDELCSCNVCGAEFRVCYKFSFVEYYDEEGDPIVVEEK